MAKPRGAPAPKAIKKKAVVEPIAVLSPLEWTDSAIDHLTQDLKAHMEARETKKRPKLKARAAGHNGV